MSGVTITRATEGPGFTRLFWWWTADAGGGCAGYGMDRTRKAAEERATKELAHQRAVLATFGPDDENTV